LCPSSSDFRGAKVLFGVDERKLALVSLLPRALEGAGAVADLRAEPLMMSESLAHERVETCHVDLQLAHLARHVGMWAAASSPVPPETRPSVWKPYRRA